MTNEQPIEQVYAACKTGRRYAVVGQRGCRLAGRTGATAREAGTSDLLDAAMGVNAHAGRSADDCQSDAGPLDRPRRPGRPCAHRRSDQPARSSMTT